MGETAEMSRTIPQAEGTSSQQESLKPQLITSASGTIASAGESEGK